MILPLHDDNPTTTRPYVTVAIIVACTVVYLLMLPSAQLSRDAMYVLGVVPAVVTARVTPDYLELPVPLTIFTSMFLHGGFWHLAGNMLYLWIFGNNIEDAMGRVRYFVFYVLCGAAAVYANVLLNPASLSPMIGASGAISGVLGAYLLLYPRARVLLGVPIGFLVVGLGRYPAVWVLLAWFGMQVVLGAFDLTRPAGAEGGIAFGAHVGGFVAGLLLVTIFKRRDVPLWRRY